MLRMIMFSILILSSVSTFADERSLAVYNEWKKHHVVDDSGLRRYLTVRGLDQVLPLHQLLRSASDWKPCHSEPFAIPPQERWQDVVSVLTLIKHLQDQHILGDMEVHSGYRNRKLNGCAHGAWSSAHTTNFALDVTTDASDELAEKLCQFWWKEGGAWKMGLSRYPSGRLHIDTKGYRTWGSTGRYASSYCVKSTLARR